MAGLYNPWTSVQNGSSELRSLRRWKDCIILGLRFRTDPMHFVHQEGGRIASSLDFKSTRDPKTSLSLYCGLQVVAATDDAFD